MPRGMPVEIALLNDRSFDLRGIHRVLGKQNAVLKIFTRQEWNGRSRRSRWRRNGFRALFLRRLRLLRESNGDKRQQQQRREQRRGT